MTHLQNYKQRTLDEFRKLVYMIEADDICIPTQINLVDRMITHLKFYYHYTPEFEKQYNEIIDKYFGNMIFIVQEYQKN